MCTNYDGYSIHAQNKRFISSHLCLYTWNKILRPLYLFLSLCRHVFDAFSCNIHHEERYLKFADISFENIDTAKKYRDNIDTFLRRYPSPSHDRSQVC